MAIPSPLEPTSPPRGIAIHALAEGGVRVVFRRASPAPLFAPLLVLLLGFALLWHSVSGGALVGVHETPDFYLLAGFVFTFFGLLFSALFAWQSHLVSSCVVMPGRLDIYGGGFRPRLLASLSDGPLEAVRQEGRDRRPGPLCVQVRVPFVARSIAIYYGEDDAAWIARYLAKEAGWQVYISPDAGHRDPSLFL